VNSLIEDIKLYQASRLDHLEGKARSRLPKPALHYHPWGRPGKDRKFKNNLRFKEICLKI
jgi:hypothetical protein